MRSIDYGDFESACETADCTLTHKLFAPMYVQNSQCSLLWKNSSFLIDDKLWQPVFGGNEGITLTMSDQQFRGMEIKVLI